MNRNDAFPGFPGEMPGSPQGAPGFPEGTPSFPGEIPAGIPEMPGAGDFASLYEQPKNERPVAPPTKVLSGVIGAGNGGMSTYAVNLFKELPEDTYDVTFLSTAEHPFFENQIKERYGRIKVIPPRNRHPLAHRKAVRRILQEQKYDVVHIHLSTASNIVPLEEAVKAHVPVIIAHIHSAGAEGGKLAALLHKLNVGKLAKLPITRLACSDAAGKFAYGKGSYTVMLNGIDLSRYYWDAGRRDRFRRSRHIPADAFVVGHMGRFSPVKNHAFLLELFAEVKKQRENAVLLLCGDGPLLKETKEKAAAMGIGESVVFTGNIVNPQDAYCAMDVMVLPSLFEGFPLTVVEAAAEGLPVLVSDKVTKEAGVTDLVQFFSLEEDKASLAGKVLSMDQGDARRDYGEELRQKGLDFTSQVKQIEKLYHRTD